MNKVELGEALAFVRQAAGEEEAATAWLISTVRTARELGASWPTIARVLGVAPQSAWERFHRKIEPVIEDGPGDGRGRLE